MESCITNHNLPKYAVINGLKSNPVYGPLFVSAVSDDLDIINAAATDEGDEVVAVFEDGDQIYYSRNLSNPTREFKGNIGAIEVAIVERYLRDKKVSGITEVRFSPEMELVVVSISWGDWKHDHLRADYIVEHDLGGYLFGSVVTEEDGSDCYSADRYYKF